MRKSVLIVAAATVALLIAGGGAFAAGRYVIVRQSQIKPAVVSNLRQKTVISVVSPKISLAPGALSGRNDLIARCPAGGTVVGTGFYSNLASVGYIEKFGTFVAAIMLNNSQVTLTGLRVQAICEGPFVADGATAAAGASGWAAYLRAYDAVRAAHR